MHNSKLLLTALLASMSLLTGCATTSRCPPLVEYSKEFRERLAAEIETLDDDSASFTALADYYVLRQQVRICRGED